MATAYHGLFLVQAIMLYSLGFPLTLAPRPSFLSVFASLTSRLCKYDNTPLILSIYNRKIVTVLISV